ncbi:hypothetical protein BDN71DRAFT_1451636 [Pleurotus eryngii]|uniref:Uncharacterized protein n=1 Tax=Pleurotus eryngii TaxID=5323 RepID=A0A9P5ZSL5_PLEER|nr:hypothetical protein BDN71DRAFT_1451636 [Pleurotus eryngii]
MLRTYAIWNRRRSIQLTLYILCLLVFVPSLVVTQLESASLIYGPSEGGCNLEHASVIIFVAYVLLVISETIIVTLTLIKAFQHLRHTRSSWVVQLYRDGFLFYLYLLGFAVANVIVPVAGPPELANWLATFVLHPFRPPVPRPRFALHTTYPFPPTALSVSPTPSSATASYS